MTWDGRCDECGKPAKHYSPMYDLCSDCMDDELGIEHDDFELHDCGEDVCCDPNCETHR